MRAILLILGLTALAAAQKPSPEYQIRAGREKSNQAFKAKDLKAAAESLADDFTITRGNGTAIAPKAAYLETLSGQFANPKSIWFERITDKVELSVAGPLAAEHGHWQGHFPDGRKAFGGTYLAMWRNAGAGWKIRSELFVVLTCDDAAACKDYTK
jgi:ketosteroid isomerase-like protein